MIALAKLPWRWLIGGAVIAGAAAVVAAVTDRTPRSRLEAALTKAGIKLERLKVTSEGRSPKQQAAAMVRKVQLYGYGPEEFHALYGDDEQISALMPALERQDVEAVAQILEHWQAQGRPLSPHMDGRGVDFKVQPPLTAPELTALDAALPPDADIIIEEDHMHYQEAKKA